MADIHVLHGDGETWTVIMHFPVPNTNNFAGVNYRTALVNSGLGGTTMTEGAGAGEITTAEKTQIDAGEVFEHKADWRIESGGTSGPELQASLRGFYAQQKSIVNDRMLSFLLYFGHTESEA